MESPERPPGILPAFGTADSMMIGPPVLHLDDPALRQDLSSVLPMPALANFDHPAGGKATSTPAQQSTGGKT